MHAVNTLRITEIFYSLQGEARTVGVPTVFVRLTGCPLRCTWCDTTYSFNGGKTLTQEEVLAQVAHYGCKTVCVTGGEPLAQKACIPFLSALCDLGYAVSLETSGYLDISPVDKRVSRVVDIKCPGSGEVDKNRWQNMDLINDHDQLKFVLKDRADFDWALQCIAEQKLANRCEIFFSPVFESLPPKELAQWILDSRAPVRMQVQLHKLLWGVEQGR